MGDGRKGGEEQRCILGEGIEWGWGLAGRILGLVSLFNFQLMFVYTTICVRRQMCLHIRCEISRYHQPSPILPNLQNFQSRVPASKNSTPVSYSYLGVIHSMPIPGTGLGSASSAPLSLPPQA